MAKVGDICEVQGRLTIEWKIRNFSSLSVEKDARIDSPNFYFSGTSWELWLYPNGETENESDGWISIYLMRKSTGCTVTLNFSLALKTASGKKNSEKCATITIGEQGFGEGFSKLISRSVLIERKTELIPSDELTVICTLENNEPNAVTRSLFSRLKNVCDNLKYLYIKAKKTDFVLKFNDQKLYAHRMILETRSPYFAAMLSHDTKENQTGEVSIVDTDKDTMDYLLQYVYSGDIPSLTNESALSLYAAADKYDIKEVKEICTDYILKSLSVEWVCDVIKFSELYEEEEISRRARVYFKENARKILETDNWRTFSKENHDLGIELLGTVVKALIP